MGEILDAFTEAFDTDRPDILDRLHHAQPLARGPYRRLVNDSITEIKRLRAQLTQERNQMNHNPDIIDRLVDLAVRLHPDSDVGSAMCDAADKIHDLKQQNLALEGRLEASRDFCDHYRKSIAEVILILENPYLTVGGTSEAYGLLKKAIGR